MIIYQCKNGTGRQTDGDKNGIRDSDKRSVRGNKDREFISCILFLHLNLFHFKIVRYFPEILECISRDLILLFFTIRFPIILHAKTFLLTCSTRSKHWTKCNVRLGLLSLSKHCFLSLHSLALDPGNRDQEGCFRQLYVRFTGQRLHWRTFRQRRLLMKQKLIVFHKILGMMMDYLVY